VVGPGRCARCLARQDQARGTPRERGYDAEWAAYSRRWLVRFPWCGQRQDGNRHAAHSRCTTRGEYTRATVTDHIRAIKDGGARLDPSNHQSLCAGCNARKAIGFEGGFGR